MSMAPGATTELDRLIEEGLTLYGQGNLDGALLVWEQVLAVDPDNPQANSYVDYVRMNYELLTSDLGDEDAGPFGIADDGEPEYQIEILLPPEPPPGSPPLHMDPLDEGWFIGDDGYARSPHAPAEERSDRSLTLELEADEPPEQSTGVSFEDATREYESAQTREAEASSNGEFSPEATPGFGSQVTDVRPRDLGFVKPTATAAPPRPVFEVEPLGPRQRPPTSEPPELKMTLRTPQHGDEVVTSELRPPPAEEASSTSKTTALEFDDDDLISSLPSPRALHVTRDLPTNIVPPHQKAALDALELDVPIDPPPNIHGTPTRDLSAVATSLTQTQDFSDKPTQQVDRPAVKHPDPFMSAPTRELGLRELAGAGRTPTEDQPTLIAVKPVVYEVERDPENTRGDIMLAFDPIDARTAQILEEVDLAAPANEPREDKTRRRISALVDQAQVWAKTTELDKAVAAIDLALSEDPNSALAQKLIHRNRDSIMGVFQAFLGNLDRQPSLSRPLHELGAAPISPRAAFLLSRIDGTVTLDEILDISGMPRLEAYRYLSQLFLRGILR